MRDEELFVSVIPVERPVAVRAHEANCSFCGFTLAYVNGDPLFDYCTRCGMALNPDNEGLGNTLLWVVPYSGEGVLLPLPPRPLYCDRQRADDGDPWRIKMLNRPHWVCSSEEFPPREPGQEPLIADGVRVYTVKNTGDGRTPLRGCIAALPLSSPARLFRNDELTLDQCSFELPPDALEGEPT